jgi:hypothetical protein
VQIRDTSNRAVVAGFLLPNQLPSDGSFALLEVELTVQESQALAGQSMRFALAVVFQTRCGL